MTTQTKTSPNTSEKLAPLTLATPSASTDWFEEPELLFANGMGHIDPKVGIPLYGPRSFGTPRHKREVHIGMIGTGEAVANARTFYEQCAEGVLGDEDNPHFPGCKADRGFRCDLKADLVEPITRQEFTEITGIKRSKERFNAMLNLLLAKTEIITQKDHPLRLHRHRAAE